MAAAKNENVNEQVKNQKQSAEHHLKLRSKMGVKDRRDVILDKAALIALLAAERFKPFFQICQRTRKKEKLDQNSPNYGRQMQPYNTATAQRQQSAEYYKKDEAKMKDENKVS